LLEKETIVGFFYRNADPDYGEWQAKELRVHLEMVLSPFED